VVETLLFEATGLEVLDHEICLMSACPLAVAMSMVTKRLLRLQAVKSPACWASSPRSARICVHHGPASTRERSSTWMPARATAGVEASVMVL
jgi:hypothetical protein